MLCCQVLPTASSATLIDVKSSLDFEEIELRKIKEKMKIGIELLNEKDTGLKELSRMEVNFHVVYARLILLLE